MTDKKNKPTADGLRDRAADAIGSARETAIDAYDNAREKAAAAGRKAGATIEDAPLLALAGGIAAGAVLAALLPKSKAEQKVLGAVGERVTGSGKAAVDAARTAGLEKLSELNLTRDAGAGLMKNILDGLGEAARSSGQAAVGAVKNPR